MLPEPGHFRGRRIQVKFTGKDTVAFRRFSEDGEGLQEMTASGLLNPGDTMTFYWTGWSHSGIELITLETGAPIFFFNGVNFYGPACKDLIAAAEDG